MDTFYIREKNLCSQRIRETESYIKRSEDTLKNLQSKSNLSDFEKSQIEKTLSQIQNLQNENLKLKQRQEDLKFRKLDSEYYDQLKQAKIALETKSSENTAKSKKEPNNKPISTPKPSYKPYYSNNASEKSMDYELKRFLNSYDYIPDKTGIKKQLSELPNNKGYIYNGVWFFGEKPAEEGQNLVMYEKLGNILRSYEHKEDMIYIYEKAGKDKKKLMATEKYSKFHDHIIRSRSFF